MVVVESYQNFMSLLIVYPLFLSNLLSWFIIVFEFWDKSGLYIRIIIEI